MFVGHDGLSFVAAARADPPRLGTLFVAAQLVDVAFFAFLPLASSICGSCRGLRR